MCCSGGPGTVSLDSGSRDHAGRIGAGRCTDTASAARPIRQDEEESGAISFDYSDGPTFKAGLSPGAKVLEAGGQPLHLTDCPRCSTPDDAYGATLSVRRLGRRSRDIEHPLHEILEALALLLLGTFGIDLSHGDDLGRRQHDDVLPTVTVS